MQHSLNAAVNREALSQYVLDTLNAAVVRKSVGQYSFNTLNATVISPIRLRTIQSQYSQFLCHKREDSGQYSPNILNATVIRERTQDNTFLILSMPVIRERTQDNTVSILSMPLSSERGHRYRMVMIIPWWVRRFWRQNMLRKALRNPVLRKQ